MTGERMACDSDVLFSDGPSGYFHLEHNDKIYSFQLQGNVC